jgi:nucleolar protein 58
MGVFVLTETSAGYGLFKSTDKKILKKEDFSNVAQSAEQVNEL